VLWIINITLIHSLENIPLQQRPLYTIFLEEWVTKLASTGNLFSARFPTHINFWLIDLAEGPPMSMMADLHNCEQLCPLNLQVPYPIFISHMAILSSPFQHWVARSYCSDFVNILEKEKATWSRYASYSLTFPLPATLDLWRTVKKFWENKRDHLNKRDGPENFMEKNLCLCTQDVRHESTTDSLHWLECS